MKIHAKSASIAPRINIGNGWMWVVSFTLRPPYHRGKRTRYPPAG